MYGIITLYDMGEISNCCTLITHLSQVQMYAPFPHRQNVLEIHTYNVPYQSSCVTLSKII